MRQDSAFQEKRLKNRERALELGPKDPARAELDGLILNIELTLISVIQGTALYFLIDTSRGLILNTVFESWPYLFTGLLFLLTFWARALLHIVTVIKWPLEFGHNFLYVGCVIVEAIMFTQAGTFTQWYTMGIAYGAMALLLFVFDQRMVVQKVADSRTQETKDLCEALTDEHRLNARYLMPGFIVFFLAATLCLHWWPSTFIERGWHLAFGVSQVLIGLLYLNHVVHFYLRLAPKILASKRAEQFDTKSKEDEE